MQKSDLISVVQSRKGRKDKFKELLNRLVQGDANVNASGEHGNTALHHAVLVSYPLYGLLEFLIYTHDLPTRLYVGSYACPHVCFCHVPHFVVATTSEVLISR